MDGWGTALKPAHEPVVVARKPLIGTVAGNVLAHGTGALNIDGCRIGHQTINGGNLADNTHLRGTHRAGTEGFEPGGEGADATREFESAAAGRWPANVVLSHADGCVSHGLTRVRSTNAGPGSGGVGAGIVYGTTARTGFPGGHADEEGLETVEAWECAADCPVRALDEQTGTLASGDAATKRASGADANGNAGAALGAESRPSGAPMVGYGDAGGASRFFYCSKASSAERNAGLGDMEPRRGGSETFDPRVRDGVGEDRMPTRRNTHPTVKSVALMRWLIRLVTPPGGSVLDPFCGSGSTGCAAMLEPTVGRFVGVEREPEYVAISRARIAWWAEHPDGMELTARLAAERERTAVRDAGQLDLF